MPQSPDKTPKRDFKKVKLFHTYMVTLDQVIAVVSLKVPWSFGQVFSYRVSIPSYRGRSKESSERGLINLGTVLSAKNLRTRAKTQK